jgi:hypothetical protein
MRLGEIGFGGGAINPGKLGKCTNYNFDYY